MAQAARRDPVRPGIFLNQFENSEDPYTACNELRENYPVCQLEPDGLWAVSRYDDVQFALNRPDLFSSSGTNKALLRPDWLREDCKRDLFILTMDPPEHRKYRAIVHHAFTRRAATSLVPLMREACRALLGGIMAGKEVDFLESFAYPYIHTIVGHITGIAESQTLGEVRRWMKLIGRIQPTRPAQEFIDEFQDAVLKQKANFDAIIEDRRRCPRHDLASEIVHARVDGQVLPDNMLRNALDLLLAAGYHTSLQFLCFAILFLSQRQDVFQSLRTSRELIPAFIEELLRFESVAPALLREATRPVRLSGVVIPEGATVLIFVAAANRDPRRFSDPDTFEMDRENAKQHLAFGHGPHTCLGAGLLRLEIETALDAILSRFGALSCPARKDLEWSGSAMIRSVKSLPVVFSE